MININYYMGLDLSINSTGVAIMDENGIIIHYNEINNKKLKNPRDKHLVIYKHILKLIRKYKPELTVIENTFLRLNVDTKQKLDRLAGQIQFMLWKHNLEFYYVSTMTLKEHILGNCKQPSKKQIKDGAIKRDLKKEMQFMIINKYNLPKNTSDNMTDAIGLCLVALNGIKDKPKKKRL